MLGIKTLPNIIKSRSSYYLEIQSIALFGQSQGLNGAQKI